MKVRKICVKPDAKLTTRWVKGPNFWWFHPRLTSAETFAPSSPVRACFCARWELRRWTCHQKVCARFAQKSANVFRVETSPQTFCWKNRGDAKSAITPLRVSAIFCWGELIACVHLCCLPAILVARYSAFDWSTPGRSDRTLLPISHVGFWRRKIRRRRVWKKDADWQC